MRASAPVSHGFLGVFGIKDAFENELAAPSLLDPFHIVPAERRVAPLVHPGRQRLEIADVLDMSDDVSERSPLRPKHVDAPARFRRQIDEIGDRHARRRRKPIHNVLVALSEDCQIEGENERGAARGLGAIDEVAGEIAVAHDVKLEPERARRVLRHVLDRTDAHGRQSERNARLFRGAGGEDFAVGMLHAGHAGRRQRDGHRHRKAGHRRLQRSVAHVDPHPLPELDGDEVGLIGPIGAFGPGAGIAIVVEHSRDPPSGERAQVRHRRYGPRHPLILPTWPTARNDGHAPN